MEKSTQKYQEIWGNVTVWVPFGKEGIVKRPGGKSDYILKSDILNPASIQTLVGVPVYKAHPESLVVIPDNYKQSQPIGVVLDKWRESADGLGGEVLVRLWDRETIDLINLDDPLKQLIETSPCYIVKNGIRYYNHLALLVKNGACGGAKMQIHSEGYPIDRSSPILGIQLQNTIQERLKMEEIQNSLTALTEAVSKLTSMVEAATCEDIMEEGCDPVYSEGLVAGEVIATAKNLGFITEETTRETVAQAKSYVVAKAFENLKVESLSADDLNGAYTAALSVLSATPKPETPPAESKQPEPAKTATLFVEGQTPVTKVVKRLGKQTK